ncbi:MAG TPA: heavy metal transporter [Chloroflexi bacterium]|nr:heavy metal transporter [Chloroflexota bacterium]
MNTQALSVPNISCNHCVMTIERELRNLEGVVAVDANAETKQVVVKWDDPASLEEIKALLTEINYPPA